MRQYGWKPGSIVMSIELMMKIVFYMISIMQKETLIYPAARLPRVFLNSDISFDDIKAGMLLTYTCSADGELFRIKTEYSTVDGTLSAVDRTLGYVVVLRIHTQ